MKKRALAEQKFRPLKKEMQQTFRRIKQAVQANAIPPRKDVDEFVQQVQVMVSYPGFGDDAYPAIVSASQILSEHSARHDLDGTVQALAQIIALQRRCHDGIK